MFTGKEGNSWRQGLALGSKSASALAVAQQVTHHEADNPQPQFLHLQDGSIPIHHLCPGPPVEERAAQGSPYTTCALTHPLKEELLRGPHTPPVP